MDESPNTQPAPQNIVKKHRPGGLLTDLILFLLDTALTLFLFITPFCVGGAYGNFVLPEFAFGVIYVIVRIILGRVEHTKTIDVFYILLRIAGCIVAAVYFMMLFNFGSTFSWFYPVRKYLYINGNFGDAAYFDFLPDSIPENTTKYRMSFEPPVNAMAPSIDIHFYTDAAGVAEMRHTAFSKGIHHIPSNTFDDTAEVLFKSEPGQPSDLSGAEIYRDYRMDGSRIAYLISEETGYCRIFWSM